MERTTNTVWEPDMIVGSSPGEDGTFSQAERIANEVLAAASTSQIQYRPAELPLAALEMIECFLRALEAPLPLKTKELVARALRTCSGWTTEGNDQILKRLSPKLSSSSSVSLQIALSQCLLSCCSTATSSVLRENYPRVASELLKSLGVTKLLSTTSSSAFHLISISLRILSTIFDKISPISSEIISDSVKVITSWIYHRPGLWGVSGSGTPRGRVTVEPTFSAMGSFMPPSPQKSKRRGQAAESDSQSASRSRSANRDGSSGESEDGGGKSERRMIPNLFTPTGATSCPTPLISPVDVPYYPSSNLIPLFRPTKASFTSLSAKLGHVVTELHAKVINLLSTPPANGEMLLAILRLTEVLARNSPYTRIQQPLAQPLVDVLLPLVQRSEESIAISSVSALAAIFRNVLSQTSPTPQALDPTSISNVALKLLQADRPIELHAEVWGLLALTAPHATNFDLTPALKFLQSNFETATIETQESQMSFIVSLLKPLPSPSPPVLPHLSLQPFARSLLQVVRVSLRSERPQLRVLACGVLASSILAELDSTSESRIDPFGEALRLVEDQEMAVRAAACRALGLLLKSSLFSSERIALLPKSVDALLIRCTDQEAVRSSASWSLANCCDVLTLENAQHLDTLKIVDEALSLARPTNGEKIQTNGLRALGSLLRVSAPLHLTENHSKMDSTIQALCDGLSGGPAKVRWNAAAAIANALTSTLFSPLSPSPSSTITVRLLESLSSALEECPNFKVRIQSATGIMAPSSRAAYGDERTFGSIKEKVGRAGEEARRAQAPAKEVGHWEMLVHREKRTISLPLAGEAQIEVKSTGLCGSDLHYFIHGRNGEYVLRSPMALGHESAGVITSLGDGVDADQLKVGDRVAIEAGQYCGACRLCKGGRYNLCPKMRFASSAKVFPHQDGTLQTHLNHPVQFLHKLPASCSYEEASLVEPLSVALHACRRAGIRAGQTVLVFGAGAVGALVCAVAGAHGATSMVIVDINTARVDFAVREGFASAGFVLPRTPRPETPLAGLEAAQSTAKAILEKFGAEGSDGFDVVLECTGVETCMQAACARPGGKVVYIGMGTPNALLPVSAAAFREVDLIGVFRYANCYGDALALFGAGRLDNVKKLVTTRFTLADVGGAFEALERGTDKEGNMVMKIMVGDY